MPRVVISGGPGSHKGVMHICNPPPVSGGTRPISPGWPVRGFSQPTRLHRLAGLQDQPSRTAQEGHHNEDQDSRPIRHAGAAAPHSRFYLQYTLGGDEAACDRYLDVYDPCPFVVEGNLRNVRGEIDRGIQGRTVEFAASIRRSPEYRYPGVGDPFTRSHITHGYDEPLRSDYRTRSGNHYDDLVASCHLVDNHLSREFFVSLCVDPASLP